MAKDLAIVLNSGGLHSAVATALAAQKHRLVMVHVTREKLDEDSIENASRARVAFDQQTSHFKPYREHVISLPQMRGLKPSGVRAGGGGESSQPLQQEQSKASPKYVSLISQ